MREGGGRVVDVTGHDDNDISWWCCPRTHCVSVYRTYCRESRRPTGTYPTFRLGYRVYAGGLRMRGDLKWPFCVGNYTPVLYFIYVFSLGFIRVKFCVVHVFCCDRPNEWFLHPLNFGLAPRGVCSTYGPRTFSIVSYIFEER